MNNIEKSKKNLFAIVVGFCLIILITILFFFKDSFSSKKYEENELLNLEKQNDFLEKNNSIKAKDLFEKINTREAPIIIDIRDFENFEKEYILDSKNIPVGEIEKNISSLRKDRTYIIVDVLGLTPDQKRIMEIFRSNGFSQVFYLEGGISFWKKEFYPLITKGDPYSLSDQSKVSYINSEELFKIMNEESSWLQIIDLRDKKSYSEEHIKGAINIPLNEIERKRQDIPLGKKIILYGDVGYEAFQGAVNLFDMGIFNVFAFSEGVSELREKGFEFVR